MLKERLTLKSRQNIAAQIESGDVPLSKWMLERRKPKEFGETLKVENVGLAAGSLHDEDQALSDEYNKKLRENILKRSHAKAVEEGEKKNEK